MTGVELNPPPRHFKCPACGAYEQVANADVDVAVGEGAARMHTCQANGGLTLPLVEVAGQDDEPDARHIAQIGEKGSVTSIGTHHGSGRVDRTVFL